MERVDTTGHQLVAQLRGCLDTHRAHRFLVGKIDLEAFMNRNYKFNVSIQRFAYMTGRSISSFKRDFASIFSDTPNRWLIQKRLKEAYFLIDKKGKKPTDIYLDIGFEDLSPFSFAFKKKFGVSPALLRK